MKNENTEKLENQPNPKTPDEPKKSKKKPVKPKKGPKEVKGVQLPVLVEFMYTISILLLIVLALTVIGISILNGATLFTLVLRTSVTIFVMGGLLIFISSQVASGLLFSSKVEQEEYERNQSQEIKNSTGIEGSTDFEEINKAEVS